jgi:prepilin-type N-terminal cleavage/methylation domain-containing protein
MRYGFTLIELLIVVALFTFLFGAMFALLTNSDTYWKQGQNKTIETSEARRVMDTIIRSIRPYSPSMLYGSLYYNASISQNNTRFDFYQATYDDDTAAWGLPRKVTYKLNPDNERVLMRKIGTANITNLTDKVQQLSFGAGCSGCSSYSCTSFASDCPILRISLTVKQQNNFTLSSDVAFRNQEISVSNETEIEAPEEGEF